VIARPTKRLLECHRGEVLAPGGMQTTNPRRERMVRFAAAALALASVTLGLPAFSAEIVMLDFWSPHCGPCMQMKPIVHSLEQANYPIREVDTTRESQLVQQFGVTGIPCFVMLVDGREIDRQVGYTSSERLQQMFKKANEAVIQARGVRGQSLDPASGVAAAQPANPNTAFGPAPRTENPPVVMAPPGAVVPPTGKASINADFPPSLIAATVRIRVDDPQGRSFGTGTIIDSRSGEALVVTCGHLFRESKGKGPMTVEMFEVGPNGLAVVGSVPGQLVSCDLERDLAFVSIKPNRQVSVAPVAPLKTQPQQGDRVATIGCSNGKDPTLLPQRITKLDRYQGPANIEVSGAPEEGRSGGGLFNLQGQLIGVCYAADYEGNEGLYAALESIHDQLNRMNLADIYTKGADASQLAGTTGQAPDRVIRLQEPRDAIPAASPRASDLSANVPKGLSEHEQSAFEEVMKRGVTSELVIIVRPKTPGGQSDVITLDNVSPEFVQALQAQRRGTQASITR